MGAAAGHIQHIYEDYSLTFKEIIEIFRSIHLNEIPIYEKFDGQNLMFTIKYGKLLFARNKTQLEAPINSDQLLSMFDKLPHVREAFKFAIEKINEIINDRDYKSTYLISNFFKNGDVFINAEVIHHVSKNVISYDRPTIIFNNTINIKTGEVFIDFGPFSKVQYNSIISSPCTITGLKFDLQRIEQQLASLPNLISLDITIQKYLEDLFILKIHDFIKLPPDPNLTKILIDRWLFKKKSVPISHYDKEIVSKLKQFEQTQSDEFIKSIQYPLQACISKIGSEIMRSCVSTIQTSPSTNVKTITKNLIAALKISASTPSIKSKIHRHINMFVNNGGSTTLPSIEGVVFYYKNSIYKLTGSFAPINQIIGIIKYSR